MSLVFALLAALNAGIAVWNASIGDFGWVALEVGCFVFFVLAFVHFEGRDL